jgi:hypothetical protein
MAMPSITKGNLLHIAADLTGGGQVLTRGRCLEFSQCVDQQPSVEIRLVCDPPDSWRDSIAAARLLVTRLEAELLEADAAFQVDKQKADTAIATIAAILSALPGNLQYVTRDAVSRIRCPGDVADGDDCPF